MSSEETQLLSFKAISNFVLELNELFGSKQKTLKLYARLLNNTTINHTVALRKHYEAFRDFCYTNRDALLERNVKKLQGTIDYSDKVKISINLFFCPLNFKYVISANKKKVVPTIFQDKDNQLNAMKWNAAVENKNALIKEAVLFLKSM